MKAEYVKDINGKEIHAFNFVTSSANLLYYVGFNYILSPLGEKLTGDLAKVLRLKIVPLNLVDKIRELEEEVTE